MLGRLEYQRGNFDAALQVLQGIYIINLKPRMTSAITESESASFSALFKKESLTSEWDGNAYVDAFSESASGRVAHQV